MSIRLTFDTYKGKLGLTRIDYGSVTAFRGKESLLSSSTFQWTRGVESLVRLTLGSMLEETFSVSERALYDAMSKPQPWYRDLFGSTRICGLYGSRVFLKAGGHELIAYGLAVRSREDIRKLWQLVFEEPAPGAAASIPGTNNETHSWLEAEIRSEIEFGLYQTLAFNPTLRNRALNSIISNSLFLKLRGARSVRLISEVEENLSLNDRLLSKSCQLDRPLEIGIGPGGVATQAIIRQAQNSGAPLYANTDFPHAQAILGDDSHGFEAFVADISTLARASARSTTYHPLCILPATRNSMILPSLKTKVEKVVTLEEVSSSLFYISDIGGLQTLPRQADELYDQPDQGCYTFWPFSSFYRKLTGGKEIYQPRWSFDASFLMVHESIIKNRHLARTIVLTLRDAWMTLRESTDSRNHVENELLADNSLRSKLLRASGYHACLSHACLSLRSINNGTLCASS